VSTTVSKHQNFVGGEWVDASGREAMEVLNPATGETISLEDYTQIKHVMAKLD
jgi:acyl-CoA reductase-like NAD-dependent aldehyde dehydrogenase